MFNAIKSISLYLVILLLINSCTINAVWNSSYKENISQFLISESGEKVIFIGKRYHYVFDDKTDFIKDIIGWKSNDKLNLTIKNFYIDSSDTKVVINLKNAESKTLSSSELEFLKNLGFTEVDNTNVIVEKNLVLHGKIYRPEPNVDYSVSDLKNNYEVEIDNSGLFSNTTKIATTPIAIANDALLISGSVVGLAIGTPIFLTVCTGNLIINQKCIPAKTGEQ
jgi:hypothetical protein